MKQIKKIFVACLNFLITLTCIVFSQTARADQILVLSGGGSPEENHYSQYLEVKDYHWNIRSCSGSCVAMTLEYLTGRKIDILEFM